MQRVTRKIPQRKVKNPLERTDDRISMQNKARITRQLYLVYVHIPIVHISVAAVSANIPNTRGLGFESLVVLVLSRTPSTVPYSNCLSKESIYYCYENVAFIILLYILTKSAKVTKCIVDASHLLTFYTIVATNNNCLP